MVNNLRHRLKPFFALNPLTRIFIISLGIFILGFYIRYEWVLVKFSMVVLTVYVGIFAVWLNEKSKDW